MRLKIVLWEKTHGYTGAFVARKLGVSPSTWSRIKAGKQQPTLEHIKKLETEFQIDDVLELFKEER